MKSTLAPASRRLAATALAPLPDFGFSAARRAILETALLLFAERGYSGTSIRDIAKAAGLQGPTLYSHYASKEAVLTEILRIGHEEHFRRLRAALLDSEPDPRKQVQAWVRAHVGFHTAYPMLAVVTNTELHMLAPEAAAPILAVRKQSEHSLLELVERGCARKVFRIPDVWMAMAAIAGMGLRVAFWFAPGGGLSAAEVGDTYAEFALRILGAADK